MANMTLTHWNAFIAARLNQEAGNDAAALDVFDTLACCYPDNRHVTMSRAFALHRLGRTEEAAATLVGLRYATLATSLVGTSDTASAWRSQLSAITNDVANENYANLASALVAW